MPEIPARRNRADRKTMTVRQADRDSLRSAISSKTRQVSDLAGQLAAARADLARLNEELALAGRELPADQPAGSRDTAPDTAAGRIRLFRSLFRGRTDLYALRWTNRAGRSGYSPACENKWQPGVCNIRSVPCGNCANQAFMPMDDKAIYAHLAGPEVIGLYPLLPDNTCLLLAADFDRKNWTRDVAAYRDACRAEGVPVAIERSQSGNGAHAWIFFSGPVAATTARRMGSYLVTCAISARHVLDFSSYDRLFPNQDTMPKGGFGNLIALPLQHESRKSGNSVFVDDDFIPYPDQWEFLAGVEQMSPARVEQIAEQALKSGQVLGLNPDSGAPQLDPERDLTSPIRPAGQTANLPARVNAVLDSKLHIPKAGLPSTVLSSLKRLAVIQNPEFYKRERMRLSVARTPRLIKCFDESRTHVDLPRGCVESASELLQNCGVNLQVADRRDNGKKIDLRFWGALTPDQAESQKALAGRETGILVAPPGSGKTVVAINLIASRKRNTLILVNRQHLLDQWIKQLAVFLEIDPARIGRIGGGVRRAGGLIDVAMLQSLIRKGKVNDAIGGYGQVIVDECHHVPAFSFERVMSQVRSRYVTGLTATPKRRDGLDPITQMQMGPIVRKSTADPMDQGAGVTRKLILGETEYEYLGPEPEPSIHALHEDLIADDDRNDLIVRDVARALAAGRSPIILTERLNHLDALRERLEGVARHVLVFKGGGSASARRRSLASLGDIPDGESRVLLATGRYIGEGFDDPRLDTLFVTMPFSWTGAVVQYVGRLNRPYPGKSELRVYDYADLKVPMYASMLRRRLAGYRTVGYKPE
jgi:superfamily II DNA or RNA helicase